MLFSDSPTAQFNTTVISPNVADFGTNVIALLFKES